MAALLLGFAGPAGAGTVNSGAETSRSAALPAADPAAGTSPCTAIVAATERAQGMPPQLMTAISLAESGRYDPDKREIVAWPWTVNAEGEGQFFATKEAAIAAVKKLRARGVTSIDVGCMQVNLHHHPHAFESLEAAFDPVRNASYAARFLKELKDGTHSWSQAVASYHSAAAEFALPYRNKVYQLWGQVRHQEFAKQRQQVIESYMQRRAAAQQAHLEAEKKRQEVIAAYLERRAAAEQSRRVAKNDPS